MRKKYTEGFTLAELLIVVAIIAVLVAVSIPVFTAQLEKSREETDIANLRSAFAIAQADAMTENYKNIQSSSDAAAGQYTQSGKTYWAYYDIKAGTLSKSEGNAKGKGTATEGNCENFDGPNMYYSQKTAAKDLFLIVLIQEASSGSLPEAHVGFAAKGSTDISAFQHS